MPTEGILELSYSVINATWQEMQRFNGTVILVYFQPLSHRYQTCIVSTKSRVRVYEYKAPECEYEYQSKAMSTSSRTFTEYICLSDFVCRQKVK